jgi:predicted CoA-binding protein
VPGKRLTTDTSLRNLLARAETIVVVGLSPKPHRPSHRVSTYLQNAGYRVIPVHPAGGTILGERVFGSLTEAVAEVGKIDLVDVFRRNDALPALVAEVIATRPRALWLQLGVTHPEAEAAALEAGVDLVVDRCTLVEHRRLLLNGNLL